MSSFEISLFVPNNFFGDSSKDSQRSTSRDSFRKYLYFSTKLVFLVTVFFV